MQKSDLQLHSKGHDILQTRGKWGESGAAAVLAAGCRSSSSASSADEES